MSKLQRFATRGIVVLLTLSLLAIPGQAVQARHWMLADQRIWTVLRACTDGVVALAVHEASTDPKFVPGDKDQPAWVQLGVRKIANPAAPPPDIQGNLTVTPATYNPVELVPFATRTMDHHDVNSGLLVDTGGSALRYYIYAFFELTWPAVLAPGADRVIVIGGKLNQPTKFTGMVARIENCHVSQFRFIANQLATIGSARFPALNPHLSTSLPLYHAAQPGLGVVKLYGAALPDPFSLRQHDIDYGAVTYAPNASPLQKDLLTLRPGYIALQSTDSTGAYGNGDSFAPELSGDGRFMVFGSYATNLPGGNSQASQAYLRDRDADGNGVFDEPGGVSTSLVSSRPDGSSSDFGSSPHISRDGRWVVFYSGDANLVPNDTNGQWDIFVRGDGVTQRVSVASDGTESNNGSLDPAISATGRFIAFASYATNLAPGTDTTLRRIYLHDRDADNNGVFDEPGPGKTSTILVSKDDQGNPADDRSYAPGVSADGRYVAYDSYATNLVPGDTNAARDVFLFDRLTDHTERISVASDGQEGDKESRTGLPHMVSDDGRYVAFQSDATNLLPDGSDSNGLTDVYLRDRAAGQTRLISYNYARSGPGNGGDGSWFPSISANGRWIAFVSSATDLLATDLTPCTATTTCEQVYVYDQETNETVLASASAGFAQANGTSWYSDISADGSFVAYGSQATNLAANDTNNAFDVFVAAPSFPFYFPILTNRTVFLPFQRR